MASKVICRHWGNLLTLQLLHGLLQGPVVCSYTCMVPQAPHLCLHLHTHVTASSQTLP